MPKLTQQQIRVLKRKFGYEYMKQRAQRRSAYNAVREAKADTYHAQDKALRAKQEAEVAPILAKTRELEAKRRKLWEKHQQQQRALAVKVFGPEPKRVQCEEDVWADLEFKLTFGDPQDEAAALKLIANAIDEALK